MTCSRTLKHGDCVKKKMGGLPATWELPVWIRQLTFKVFLYTVWLPSASLKGRRLDTCFPGNVCDGLTALPFKKEAPTTNLSESTLLNKVKEKDYVFPYCSGFNVQRTSIDMSLISVQLKMRIKELLPQELMEALGYIQQASLDR